MTITRENLIEYDTSQVKDNEKQSNNMQTNTKRQVNQHPPNNQNITEKNKHAYTKCKMKRWKLDR